MSQDNLDIMRRAYSLAKESETYGFLAADQDLYDEYFHPDAELVPPAIYPDTEPTYSGFDGFNRFQRQLDEIWDDWRFEAERFFDAGDQVVVFVRISGTGKQSGAAVAISTAHLFSLRDGRATRFEIFLDRHEALKAVGLAG